MDTKPTHPINLPLKQAIERAGGQVALGQAIGRSQTTISDWLHGNPVSAQAAVAIELATGIPAEQVCPPLADYAALRGLRIRKKAA